MLIVVYQISVSDVSFVLIYQVYGRHVASDRMVSGAYKTEYGADDEITEVISRVQVTFLFINKQILF